MFSKSACRLLWSLSACASRWSAQRSCSVPSRRDPSLTVMAQVPHGLANDHACGRPWPLLEVACGDVGRAHCFWQRCRDLGLAPLAARLRKNVTAARSTHAAFEAARDFRERCIVHGLGPVVGLMIKWIAINRSICRHDRWKSGLAISPVIGEMRALDKIWHACSSRWKIAYPAECSNGAAQKFSRAWQTDKREEVSSVGINNIERKRQVLAARGV